MYTDSSVAAFSGSNYQPLGQKTFWFIVSKRVSAGLFFLFVAFVLSLARGQSFVPADMAPVVRGASWFFIGLAVVSLAVGFASSWFIYRSAGFLLSEDALRIRRGVFTKQETAIPYRQIQNIDIERTVAQRVAGLSKLVVYTAGNDDSVSDDEGVIPSIDWDVAERLQGELLKRANVQKVSEVRL